MDNQPLFRVFLNDHKLNPDLKKLFKHGIPCCKVIAPFDEFLTLENANFEVDSTKCNPDQLKFLNKLALTQHDTFSSKESHHKIALNFQDIDYVINVFEQKLTFDDFFHVHSLTCNAYKISGITFNLDGMSTHVLINTLQRSLIDPLIKNSEFIDQLMELITLMIIRITDNDENLKRSYLQSFPSELVMKASFLLFPD